MKKHLLWAALWSGSIGGAQAQTAISAGTVSLGGMVGYSRYTDEQARATGVTTSYTESQFQFTPSVGYFVADNLAVRLEFNYLIRKERNTGTGNPVTFTPTNQLRAGAYVQYYKLLTDKFGLLGTLGAGYQHRKTDGYNPIDPEPLVVTRTGFYTQLTPGIIYFPTPKLGISASVGYLGYERMKLKSTDRSTSDFGAAFGFDQLLFGGTYYIGR